MNKVLIHCQPTLLDTLNELGLEWDYSQQHGINEIDVIVPNIEFNDETIDHDVLLSEYYGIDYDQVNCFELVS